MILSQWFVEKNTPLRVSRTSAQTIRSLSETLPRVFPVPSALQLGSVHQWPKANP